MFACACVCVCVCAVCARVHDCVYVCTEHSAEIRRTQLIHLIDTVQVCAEYETITMVEIALVRIRGIIWNVVPGIFCVSSVHPPVLKRPFVNFSRVPRVHSLSVDAIARHTLSQQAHRRLRLQPEALAEPTSRG